jgi:quercetin dioxygenase-like cupin family protein
VISIKRLEHVGIIVDDLDEAARFLQERFCLARDGEADGPGLRAAFFTPGSGARVEIIEATDPEVRRRRLGEGNTARIEHVAFEVDDLDAVVETLEALGVAVTEPPRRSGRHRTTWTVPATTDGVMFQLSEVDPGGQSMEAAAAVGAVVLHPELRPTIDRGGGATTTYLAGPDVGARAIMNGITSFEPGSSIPFHWHNCEESVIVLDGVAAFEDEQGMQRLKPGDTTFVPSGVTHRFTNPGDGPMRILWTYASPRATRTIAATGETHPVVQDGPA